MKKITCRHGDGSTYETVCYSKNGPLVIAKMLPPTGKAYAIIHVRSGGAVCYRDTIAALRPLLPELNAITDWDRPFAEIVAAVPDLALKVDAVANINRPYINEKALSW